MLPGSIVCGGANNQLATPGVAEQLRGRGILYAPDYLVNAGGVIQVEDERHGFSFARAQSKASGIFDVALRVFRGRRRRGGLPRGRRRPAGRGADPLGRPAGDHPAASLSLGGTGQSPLAP